MDDQKRYRVVEGEKTRLRPALWGFSEDELQRRYHWSQDDELQYWSGTIPGGPSYPQFKETVMQRDWPTDGRRMSYAILTKAGELIGMVSIYGIDWRSMTGELGVYLGQHSYWGHGYGTDAITAFLRHLFMDFGFRSVYLHTYENNVRAQRSYQHVGFKQTDTRRRFSQRLGYHNEVRMDIDRDTFAALHGLRERAAAT